MARIVYLNKDGKQITPLQWVECSKSKKYCTIREYDNGKLRVYARWIGKAMLETGQPLSTAKIFRLVVFNVLTTDGEGRPLPEPKVVEDKAASGYFSSMKALIANYEDLLVNYADCEWVPSNDPELGGQRFIEKGIKLAPLDKKIPVVDEGVNESTLGSW